MTPYEPSTEDVELVARGIRRHHWRECACGGDTSPETFARELLASLAGRLLPSGGQVRVEVGCGRADDVRICPGATIFGPCTSQKWSRTVTSYSSGPIAEVVGRWEEVNGE